MSNVYVNLVPIKSGGGLQNALNLINGFSELEDTDEYIYIIRSMKLKEKLEEKGLKYKIINDNIFCRLIYELFYFNRKKAIIFTLFGGKPLISYGCKTISGCAYSNLFYPEIDFWEYLNPLQRFKKKLIDWYRYYLTKKSDVIIFETETLKNRAELITDFQNKRLEVVKMAVNKDLKRLDDNNLMNSRSNTFNILYLASSHPNKRQHLIVPIAEEMRKMNIKCKFILTMNNNSYTDEIKESINNLKLFEYIQIIPPVSPDEISAVISNSDSLINIAKLESFSNNFVEAWTFQKPLIVTEADWSRDNCKNAALYINPEDPEASANAIIRLINDKHLREYFVDEGIENFRDLNDYRSKSIKYINIIKEVES